MLNSHRQSKEWEESYSLKPVMMVEESPHQQQMNYLE